MKKPLKILAWLCGISLFLVIAAFVALKILLPVEKMRKLTVELLSAQLHREVKLDGISIALGGVKINGLAVSELPDFSKGTMLKTDSVQVSFRLLPLLRKQFEIGRISIDGLQANIVRGKDGLFNFSDISAKQASGQAQAVSSSTATAAMPAISISKLSLADSFIAYKDDALGFKADIRNLDFQGREISLNKPFSFSLSMEADFDGMGAKARLPLSLDAKVNSFDPGFPSSGLVVLKAALTDAALEYSKDGMAVKIAKLDLRTSNASMSAAFPLSVSLEADYSGMGAKARLPLSIDVTVNPAAPSFPAAGIDVKKVDISGGTIEYAQAKKMAVKLTDVQLSASNASPDKAFPLSLSMNADYKSPQFSGQLPVSLDMAVNPGGGKPEMFSADIKALHLAYGKFALDGTAKVSSLNAPQGVFKFKTQSVKASELKALLPQAPSNAVLPDISVEGEYSLNAAYSLLALHNVKIQAGKLLSFTGKSMIGDRNPGKWSARSSFVLNVSDLAEAAVLLPMLKEYSPQGKVALSGEVIYEPPSLSFDGAATLGKVGGRFQNYVMKNLEGDLRLTADSVQSKMLRGSVNQAEFTAVFSAIYSMARKTASVTANLDVGEVDIASFMPPQPAGQKAEKAPPVDFTVNADVNAKARRLFYPNFEAGPTQMSCSLRNLNMAALGRLNGNASFNVKGGYFQDLSRLAEHSTMAKMFLFPVNVLQKASRLVKVQLLPNFDDIKYTSIEGRYRIVNGLVTIEKSQLLSSAADIDSSGTLNLANEAIAMKITAKVPVAKAPLVVPMTVTGTMSSPKTSVNMVEMAKSEAAQGVVQEGVKAGAKLLQGLFK